MATKMDDQRRFSRSAVQVRAELRLPNGVLMEGQTENVSLNGMLIHTDRQLPVGHPCNAVLVLSAGEQEVRLNLAGRVARVSEAEVGVEFDQIELDGLEHLRRLVLYNADDPDAVEQEFSKAAGLSRVAH